MWHQMNITNFILPTIELVCGTVEDNPTDKLKGKSCVY